MIEKRKILSVDNELKAWSSYLINKVFSLSQLKSFIFSMISVGSKMFFRQTILYAYNMVLYLAGTWKWKPIRAQAQATAT